MGFSDISPQYKTLAPVEMGYISGCMGNGLTMQLASFVVFVRLPVFWVQLRGREGPAQ